MSVSHAAEFKVCIPHVQKAHVETSNVHTGVQTDGECHYVALRVMLLPACSCGSSLLRSNHVCRITLPNSEV